MYLWNHAIANLGRNKSRNVLLGGMMVLILFTGTISIMIHQATTQQIAVLQKQFGASLILYRDDKKLDELTSSLEEYQEPSLAQFQSFATVEHIKETKLIASVPASLQVGKALDEDRVDVSGIQKDDVPGETLRKPATNMIFGTNHKTINEEFESGLRKIVEGNMFTKENEGIVSQQLAQLNQWKVGDTIVLNIAHFDQTTSNLSMKITGIYEDHTNAYESDDLKMALLHRGNEIITSFATLTSLNSNQIGISANFTIDDPKHIAQVEQAFHELGLPAYFSLKADDLAYQKAIAPLESLRDVTKTLLIAVLGIGGTMLVVLSILAIKERTYEVGVLRAMGMKKRMLACQFLIEGICLTALCLLLAFSLAKATSQPIAQVLFEAQPTSTSTAIQQEQATSYSAPGGFHYGAGVTVEQIELTITQAMMIEIIGMALLFAIISSIGGIAFVMRYEPRKILSERT